MKYLVLLALKAGDARWRLHVLTALALLVLLLITTCADSPRSSASLLVWQLPNWISCVGSLAAWY